MTTGGVLKFCINEALTNQVCGMAPEHLRIGHWLLRVFGFMAWFLLAIAVVLEIVWASTLKATDGYTRLWPTVFNVVVLAINMYVLAQVFKLLPTGTAYAAWTGLGVAGIAAVGIFIYGESATFSRLFFILLTIAGVERTEVCRPELNTPPRHRFDSNCAPLSVPAFRRLFSASLRPAKESMGKEPGSSASECPRSGGKEE